MSFRMYLKEIKNIFLTELNDVYSKEEASSIFSLFVEHYLNLERFVLVLHPDHIVTKEEEQLLFLGLSRLKNEEPVQYILGEVYFMDLLLKVNPGVLIPRPETEELVEWVIKEAQVSDGKLKILDIGTGSGCIAVALAKKIPNVEIFALDISAQALKVAKQNAEKHQVNIQFIEGDILNCDLNSDFDIIVSNPPYVRELEMKDMANNVKKYEPKTALYVPNEDPLKFYKAIVSFSEQHLKVKGTLFLEINQYLAEEMKQLMLKNEYLDVDLRKDIFGNFRMVKAIKS